MSVTDFQIIVGQHDVMRTSQKSHQHNDLASNITVNCRAGIFFISSVMKVEVNKKVLAQFLNLEFFSLRQNA